MWGGKIMFLPMFPFFWTFPEQYKSSGYWHKGKATSWWPLQYCFAVLLSHPDYQLWHLWEGAWRSLNYTVASLSHFSASSLCCASKLASVLRALHLIAPAYVSNWICFYSFSPWSVLGDLFFQLLPSLTGLFLFLSPLCAFNTFL